VDRSPSGSFSGEPGKEKYFSFFKVFDQFSYHHNWYIKTLQGQSENGRAPWEGVCLLPENLP